VPVDTLRAVILTVKFLIYNENRSAKPSRRHLNGMIVLLEELKRTYKSYERKSTSKSVRGRLLSAKVWQMSKIEKNTVFFVRIWKLPQETAPSPVRFVDK